MEYIVEKIGMTRTLDAKCVPITLLRVVDSKVVEVIDDKRAIVAFVGKSKHANKAVQGQQKKYDLSKEFNSFASLEAPSAKAGDSDLSFLANAAKLKLSFTTKGRGFSGVIKRHNFSGGPESHGSRFHRRVGSIGNAEFPGRVKKNQKMPGQYGNALVSQKASVVSFDENSKIIAIKGSVAGANGSFGRIKVIS